MNILEVIHVSKSYGDFELKDISFELPAGKIIGLLGENGAGKTTLLGILLQQIKKDSGIIKFEGKELEHTSGAARQEIGFVLDECCFPLCFHAKDISSVMRHIYKGWDDALFMDFLKRLGVDANKKISQMSKGMKNKLLLSAALSHTPKLLIMDEVTSGLDPVVRFDVLKILKDYVKDHPCTVLFSTHMTSDLEKIADEFLLLHEGELLFWSKMEDLTRHYRILCTDASRRYSCRSPKCTRAAEGGKPDLPLIKAEPGEAAAQAGMEMPNLEKLMLILSKETDMWGLIKKDLLVIRKETTPITFVALIPPLFAGYMNPLFFLLMLVAALAMLLGMQILNTMAYDEKVNWRKNVMAFPILPEQEAGSKYCIMFFLACADFILTFLVGLLAKIIFLDVSIGGLAIYSLIGMIMVIFYNILIIPAGYYWGCDKVKYILFLMIMLPFGIGIVMARFGFDMNILLQIPLFYLLSILILAVLCITALSFFISQKVLQKKLM